MIVHFLPGQTRRHVIMFCKKTNGSRNKCERNSTKKRGSSRYVLKSFSGRRFGKKHKANELAFPACVWYFGYSPCAGVRTELYSLNYYYYIFFFSQKHFSDDSDFFQVFTVTSKEFNRLKYLQEDDTGRTGLYAL